MEGNIIVVFVIVLIEIIGLILLHKAKFLSTKIDFKSSSFNVSKSIDSNDNSFLYSIESDYNKYINEYKIYDVNGEKKVSFFYKDYFSIVYYLLMYDDNKKLLDVKIVNDTCCDKQSDMISIKNDCTIVDVFPIEVNYEKVNDMKFNQPKLKQILLFSAIVSILVGLFMICFKLFWDYIAYYVYDFVAKFEYDVYDYITILGFTAANFILMVLFFFVKEMRVKKEEADE